MTALYAFGGLAAGALLVWLYCRSRDREVTARLDERTREVERLRRDVAAADAARAQVGRLTAELEAERRAAAEKLALLADAQVKLREAFTALSADALQANNRQFLELAQASLSRFQDSATTDLGARQEAIASLVKPIEDGLRKVDERLGTVEKERVGAYAELRTHVEGMARSQQQLQAETANLVKALRTPHIRGSWGEIQLRRVVEMAGMVEHCDFAEQASVSDGNGGMLRPDLVIRLPGGKSIVVDSKAPLLAYLEAADAADEDARVAALLLHARQVKTHIAQLAAKAYWKQFADAPDFVVMFLPGESFFSAACQCDPGLVDFAVAQHVIPASPTTLITLLKTVQFGWRQERIAANAQEISDLGRDLYDRLRTFREHLEACGESLAKSVEHYNRAVGSFEGRLLVSGRRFQELGCGTGDDIGALEPIDETPRRVEAGA
jgi:DNA recombination protein RmuC